MNVEEALSFAASLEANYEEYYRGGRNDNFGHPETPKVALQKLFKDDGSDVSAEDSVHLLVVYTKHCIAAQVVAAAGDVSSACTSVVHLGTVGNPNENDMMEYDDSPGRRAREAEGDETIQCLLVLELEDINICSARIPKLKDTDRSFVLAVVTGTDQSRLLVSELLVQQNSHNGEWTIHVQHRNNLLEVIPRDSNSVADYMRRKNKQMKTTDDSPSAMAPFQPLGGVSSLFCGFDVTVNPLETPTSYVWITFKDGNIVRMHHAALFPSTWAEGSDAGVSVDDLLLQYNHTALCRCKVRISPGDSSNAMIVPLPKYHPSPLAPVIFEGIREFQQNYETCYEALVFGNSDLLPTLCVYTSEDHFWEPQPVKKSDSFVTDVTKAFVGGVVGALRWATKSDGSRSGGAHESDMAHEPPSTPFPSVWKMPVSLFPGAEFHDVPRVVEHCAVDPDGRFAAMADGLGRVILFDLSTKQIVRMWKGLRQASCCWTKVPVPIADSTNGGPRQPNKQSQSYLVVHSKQRRSVEVWPPRSGNRLVSFQVHRDSVIVSCPDSCSNRWRQQENGRVCHVFVLDSSSPAGAATILKRIEVTKLLQEIQIQDENGHSSKASSREATMHVQHLKQLLSAERVMFCTKDDVLEAFCRIKSLSDLSWCLDLVAKASVLEEDLHVEGSTFQKLILKYCSDMLQEATKANDGTLPSAGISLSKKIDYYSRLIKSYDVLRAYEYAGMKDGKKTSHPISNFSREAIGWADIYDIVTGSNMDAELRPSDAHGSKFSQFASSCVFPAEDSIARGKMKVYLSESTRTRQDILAFIFRPLLGWFSSGIVISAFEALGIRDDFPYLVKCFSEWFLTLRREDIEERCLNQPDSPMIRFLQDALETEFDMFVGLKAGDGAPAAIGSLLFLCEQSTDLVRAFMLATLGREVQLRILKHKEESTFSSPDMSKRYNLVKELSRSCENLEWLLRKIRVCLLVSLRLHGMDLAPFPLSVKNIEKESDFSVYKWIALDELSMTQKHEEIVTLETACGLSHHRLNPFSVEADAPEKFQLLQQACISMVDDENLPVAKNPDGYGSLLLNLGAYNSPDLLAAHRALLLASEWTRDPGRNHFLWRAITALKSLPEKTTSVSVGFAVTLDLWTRAIAPVYRARLFGLSDLPEIREEYVAPLLENPHWMREFGRMALQILIIIGETSPKYDKEADLALPAGVNDEATWPRMKGDYVLASLMKKARQIESTALQTHVVAVCAMLFSDDMGALTDCIPALGDCFQPTSLYNPMNTFPPRDSRQEMFLSDAVVSFAYEYCGGQLDSFRVLGELEILASKWGFDQKWLRTTFMIAMYELGRDADVDGLMTAAASQILPQHLIVAGVNIVCRRLDSFLVKARLSRGTEARSILGLLDAELCEWIHQRAESSEPIAGSVLVDVPVKTSQVLTIRLLSLASTSNADGAVRSRIHALSVLSGTLVKATEGRNL